MGNEKNSINWEKISLFISCVGFVSLFWYSQDTTKEKLSETRERLAKVEERIQINKEKKIEPIQKNKEE